MWTHDTQKKIMLYFDGKHLTECEMKLVLLQVVVFMMTEI